MARQKTAFPGARKAARGLLPARRSDADHVSAAMLAFRKEAPIVLVAKNVGLTEDDENTDMLRNLRIWLRAVCLDGRRRLPTGDRMLSKMVKYNQKRIEHYVELLRGNSARIRGSEPEHVANILKKCAFYKPNVQDSHHLLLEIVSLAYVARYKCVPGVPPKVVKAIACIGRVEAAWATFVEFAMHHAGCRDIEIQAADSRSSPPIPSKVSHRRLKQTFEDQSGNWSTSIVKATRQKLQSGKKSPLLLFTHAEMQLLAYFGSMEEDDREL